MVGARGKLLRVNGKLCEYLGYSQDELLEMSVRNITHPEDAEEDIEIGPPGSGGETNTYSLEKRYLRKAGSVVWANVSASLVRDASGEPDYFIGVVEDISQRKGAEERTQFLANLTQALQAADGPEEVKAAASLLLGEHLGADLCAYAEVETDEDHFDVVGAYSSANGPPGSK